MEKSRWQPPSNQAARDVGRVYLVGAGPGDAELITLRGVQCLREADLVLYDYLVNAQLLQHAPPQAERVCLGRHGRGRLMPQDEVHRRMIAAAQAGKTVVRLKSGDPMVFGRAAEEIAALQKAGIGFEIVPGITAALAVGSYAGIPLTHRDAASAIALVTGQQQAESEQSFEDFDYEALAHFPGTLVFYMAVTTAPRWTESLMAGGKPADTPAAIVRRCSFADQQVFRCTLGTVVDEIRRHGLRPPAVVVVGPAVALGEGVSWFTNRPLFGRRVLVTRSAEQAASLRQRFESLGADVLEQPAIRIAPPEDWNPVDRALAELERYDWLVFSSRNGVDYLLNRLWEQSDLRKLATVRIAAIGPGTAEALERFHLRADVVPSEYRAEALAEALHGEAAGGRFLLARANRGRDVLAQRLLAAGGDVQQVVVYQSIDVDRPTPEVATLLAAGKIDYVTVTSSAIARSLASLFGDALGRAVLASISPITSQTLRELGYTVGVEAASYTMDGLVEAVLRHAEEQSG